MGMESSETQGDLRLIKMISGMRDQIATLEKKAIFTSSKYTA
jgi:hypothetical protein